MFSLVAYYEGLDNGAVLTNIAAVQDPSMTTQGDYIHPPETLPFLLGEIALHGHANLASAEIRSPALRAMAHLQIEPIVPALIFGSPPEAIMHAGSPLPITPGEGLELLINGTPGGVVPNYGLLWLGDGPVTPVFGEMYQVAATAAVTLAAGTWVNGNLVFGQTLPGGRYAIMGMRARGTNLVAARLLFPDTAPRPGVPAVNAVADLDPRIFRFGGMGSFGEFDADRPPTVDCLGITDSAQSFIFDLLRVG